MIAVAALIAAMALVALALFGGWASPTKVNAVFESAGQLVVGNEIRVGGAVVGTISDIELNDGAQAVVTMDIYDDYAPLHEGTQATIRATSLSGIANRYISLAPGPNNAEEIEDGARSTPTRPARRWTSTRSSTRSTTRRARACATSCGLGHPVRRQGRACQREHQVLRAVPVEHDRPGRASWRWTRRCSSASCATARPRCRLSPSAVATSSSWWATPAPPMGAIADENVALETALDLLPDTLRKANTTFVNLRATLDDLDVLVAESKPATKDLAPFMRALRPLVAEARPTVADLRNLIKTPGPNNDLIDLTAKQPRLAQLTSTVFPRAIRTLDRAQPVVEYACAATRPTSPAG